MQRIKKHLVWSRLYDVSGRGFKRPPPVNQIQYRHARYSRILARPAAGDTFMWKFVTNCGLKHAACVQRPTCITSLTVR